MISSVLIDDAIELIEQANKARAMSQLGYYTVITAVDKNVG